MSSSQIEIQIIAALVAAACALPGVFLVLRKMSLISDAISHSILLGIVIGFFITHDLNSPSCQGKCKADANGNAMLPKTIIISKIPTISCLLYTSPSPRD